MQRVVAVAGDPGRLMRAFLAVPVEEPALGEVRSLVDSLSRDIGGVRWASTESAHITVHFFGGIADAEARRAAELVRPICMDVAPFALTLDTVGAFPSPSRPRVLWLGASHVPGALVDLAGACHRILQEHGFEVERRAYTPHCTLGRVRDRLTDAGLASWREAPAKLSAASCTVTQLVLYESIAGRAGAVHVPRIRMPLRGREGHVPTGP